jgi:TolB-like protein/DNA-binding winged helix-turn-helix (wHTH) protein/Flp pilus assembly protein TadD
VTDAQNLSLDDTHHHRFMVGDWLVEPDQGEMTRGTESVRVEPKVMEVLVYLARRQGEVVTRGDLERDVWKGALVGYDAVTSTVIKLRKALGDSARRPSLIRTIPKRGYQLVAPVKVPAEHPPGSMAPETRKRPTPMTKAALLLAPAIVILAGLFSWISTPRGPDAPPLQEGSSGTVTSAPPSIVVLPFENLSDDPSQVHFADGITEDIITDLSGLSDLLVIASNTSFSYKGRKITPKEVGADLKVGFVLEGSIRRHEDSVRVNAQLVDAKTGFQKWARRYDRKLDQVFAVQDEVTNSIVDALAINMSHSERARLAQRNTSSLEAYDYFREGQRLSKVSSPESNTQAQQTYRSAIRADPDYGRAYGALAYTMAFSYRRGWSDSPVQTIDQALELALKAVELDGSIPQTYWSLGYIHLMRKEYDKADAAVTRALAIAPNYADGYGLLALIKNALGEPEEAIVLIKKGMELNPYYTWDYPYNLGRAYYYLGRYEDAIAALEEARTRNENVVPVRLHLAASYVGAGRQDDAEWEVQEIQVLSPTDTISHLRVAHPVEEPGLMEKFVGDLRAAGLPE